MYVVFHFHLPDVLRAQHKTLLSRLYRKPIVFLEELTTGMAVMILVISKLTASTFANTFKASPCKTNSTICFILSC
ncbi:hypothetical protein SLA2020_129560 [Shorea laevis]